MGKVMVSALRLKRTFHNLAIARAARFVERLTATRQPPSSWGPARSWIAPADRQDGAAAAFLAAGEPARVTRSARAFSSTVHSRCSWPLGHGVVLHVPRLKPQQTYTRTSGDGVRSPAPAPRPRPRPRPLGLWARLLAADEAEALPLPAAFAATTLGLVQQSFFRWPTLLHREQVIAESPDPRPPPLPRPWFLSGAGAAEPEAPDVVPVICFSRLSTLRLL